MNKYIKCPNCGYEYLPAEIFYPDNFLGAPKNIIRNNIGEVLGYEGPEMNLEESFTCNCCETPFHITAKVSFYETVSTPSQKNKIERMNLF